MGKRARARDAGGGARTTRLQELIREEVNFLLRSEVGDPRLAGVIITMVELAGDCARLWFTVASNQHNETTDDACNEAWTGVAGFLRVQLAQSLGLKRTPELRFRRDPASTRI